MKVESNMAMPYFGSIKILMRILMVVWVDKDIIGVNCFNYSRAHLPNGITLILFPLCSIISSLSKVMIYNSSVTKS